MKKTLLACLLAASCALFAGATANAQTITSNQTGTHNGYFYSLWHTGGSVSMTLGSGSNYALSWSGVGDVVAGTGWNPGGYRTVGYNCGAYTNSGGGSRGLYGWTTGPLVEYYICEAGNPASGSYIGQVSSDGGTYNVYHHQQVNQPSIQGTQTFWQNLDIRTSANSTGQNHTITTGNHFNFWNSHGMNLGSFNYMICHCESWGNSNGYCNQTCW